MRLGVAPRSIELVLKPDPKMNSLLRVCEVRLDADDSDAMICIRVNHPKTAGVFWAFLWYVVTTQNYNAMLVCRDDPADSLHRLVSDGRPLPRWWEKVLGSTSTRSVFKLLPNKGIQFKEDFIFKRFRPPFRVKVIQGKREKACDTSIHGKAFESLKNGQVIKYLVLPYERRDRWREKGEPAYPPSFHGIPHHPKKYVVRTLDKKIADLIAANTGPLFINIFGAPGVGKSSMADALVKKFAQGERPYYCWSFQSRDDAQQEQVLLECLRGQIPSAIFVLDAIDFGEGRVRVDNDGRSVFSDPYLGPALQYIEEVNLPCTVILISWRQIHLPLVSPDLVHSFQLENFNRDEVKEFWRIHDRVVEEEVLEEIMRKEYSTAIALETILASFSQPEYLSAGGLWATIEPQIARQISVLAEDAESNLYRALQSQDVPKALLHVICELEDRVSLEELHDILIYLNQDKCVLEHLTGSPLEGIHKCTTISKVKASALSLVSQGLISEFGDLQDQVVTVHNSRKEYLRRRLAEWPELHEVLLVSLSTYFRPKAKRFQREGASNREAEALIPYMKYVRYLCRSNRHEEAILDVGFEILSDHYNLDLLCRLGAIQLCFYTLAGFFKDLWVELVPGLSPHASAVILDTVGVLHLEQGRFVDAKRILEKADEFECYLSGELEGFRAFISLNLCRAEIELDNLASARTHAKCLEVRLPSHPDLGWLAAYSQELLLMLGEQPKQYVNDFSIYRADPTGFSLMFRWRRLLSLPKNDRKIAQVQGEFESMKNSLRANRRLQASGLIDIIQCGLDFARGEPSEGLISAASARKRLRRESVPYHLANFCLSEIQFCRDANAFQQAIDSYRLGHAAHELTDSIRLKRLYRTLEPVFDACS